MRRVLILVLLALVLAAPATAQQSLNTYPGGLINIAGTAVTIANTTTATTMYSTTIPATYFGNLFQPFRGSGALHLRLFGTVTTNVSSGGVGNTNLGCNFGGTTATISLVNASALTAALSAAPWLMDVWVRQQGAGQIVFGSLEVQTAATTRVPYMASVIGTTSNLAAQTLVCTWQWASAATTNSLIINHGVLAIDN